MFLPLYRTPASLFSLFLPFSFYFAFCFTASTPFHFVPLPLFSSFNFFPVLLSVLSAYFATPCSHLIFLSLDSFISFYLCHNFAYFLSVYFSSLIFLFLLFLFLYNACSPPRSLCFGSFSPFNPFFSRYPFSYSLMIVLFSVSLPSSCLISFTSCVSCPRSLISISILSFYLHNVRASCGKFPCSCVNRIFRTGQPRLGG